VGGGHLGDLQKRLLHSTQHTTARQEVSNASRLTFKGIFLCKLPNSLTLAHVQRTPSVGHTNASDCQVGLWATGL
jgi:hypothetical protein